jgi:hypothetical protein
VVTGDQEREVVRDETGRGAWKERLMGEVDGAIGKRLRAVVEREEPLGPFTLP